MKTAGQFVVEARRWGDSETHHYVTAVTPCFCEAVCLAQFEQTHRGGKYSGIVLQVLPGFRGSRVVHRAESKPLALGLTAADKVRALQYEGPAE